MIYCAFFQRFLELGNVEFGLKDVFVDRRECVMNNVPVMLCDGMVFVVSRSVLKSNSAAIWLGVVIIGFTVKGKLKTS